MATVDRAHRIGFALIPALVGGVADVALCAAAGASPEPWMWLAAAGAGFWGYLYARRWSTEPTSAHSSPQTAGLRRRKPRPPAAAAREPGSRRKPL
ncbi:MYXO-CTERM sorting domain-containing protein [Streptomyces bacillaris]|uniref:MYXO-CTERM sorting domain-containing protein n=1 Tax=Streptomyces bacillaris TaxID=68179 RepID=UPI003810F407